MNYTYNSGELNNGNTGGPNNVDNAPNVGFAPGYLNGRSPDIAKLRYQRELTQQIYGEENQHKLLEDPWSTFVVQLIIWIGLAGVFAFCVLLSFGGQIFDPEADRLVAFLTVVGMLGFGSRIAYVAVVRPFYICKSVADYKKTPEGARHIQELLHPSIIDPQSPNHWKNNQ